MRVRFSTTSISALLLSLCLVMPIPEALSNASTWNELAIKLPFGAIWNYLAPLGLAYLGSAAIGLIVLWTGYRKRERWAWFVMLIALLFFYFPSYLLPVVLQSQRFGRPNLLNLFEGFSLGGWLHCWIGSWRPNYTGSLACVPFEILIRPLEFVVMSIALLLPIKAFFWNPVPRQSVTGTKMAILLGKQPLAWVIALLSVITIAVALMVRSGVASTQYSAAQNRQQFPETFLPYNMVWVDLSRAEHTVAMPEAASDDAIVLAVTRDGRVFLGPDLVDPSELESRIRGNRTDRTGETMYLRADRRSQYRDVENAIEAMRGAGAEVVGVLTQRSEDSHPESPLWIGNPLLKSVGLEISFPSPPKTSAGEPHSPEPTIVVHVIYRPNAAPAYKINGADVAHADLQVRLNRTFASRAERVLFIKGDDALRFSDIVDVIDIGRASNVDHIGLVTPGVTAGK